MFKWIARRLKQASAEIDQEKFLDAGNLKKATQVTSIGIDHDDLNNPIRFELSSAVGGRILKVRRYDRKTHEDDTQIYVIPQGDDVGERVTKIVNLELIK